jgi:putative membrane protein
MDIRPNGFPPPDGFRGGDGIPFRGPLVQHVEGAGPSTLAWVIFALLLVLLVLAIVSLAVDAYHRRREARPGQQPAAPFPESGDSSRALAVLDDRYARGEISRDDYLRTRDDLRGVTEATTQVIPPDPEPA